MHVIIENLLKESPVLLDGAWGTQFQAIGMQAGACPDVLNLEHPEAVVRVARSYVEAGSRIILSNTFGANRIALEKHGLETKAAAINEEGAALSKQAARDDALVFASMGPSGKMLLLEEVTRDELFDAFSEQALALARGGADGLVVETMSDIEEAKIAVTAAKTTRLPVIGCMVYDSGPGGCRTMMGVDPETQARRMESAGADVLGINCGKGIDQVYSACRQLKEAASSPLWVKANAGIPRMVDGRAAWPMPAEEFAKHATALIREGVSFIGGCCGTSPLFIRTVAEHLHRDA